METEGYTPIDKAKAEELLATATQLRGSFGTRSRAECALDGIEVNANREASGL